MLLANYAEWAENEVTKMDPVDLTRGWAGAWGRTLEAMRTLGVYEHAALVVAKWEFLGGLYKGSETTDVKEARLFAGRFLQKHIEPKYVDVHDLSGRCATDGSDFFTMLRNKPLHGFTPAAIFREPADVIAWSIPTELHLEKNAENNLCVSSISLQRQLVESADEFASYLATDKDGLGGGTNPKERWRRGFWARYCPAYYPRVDWMMDGHSRGLFR